MISTVIEIALMLLLASLVLGSLLNLSSHPHWFVRGWDFPRVQIIATAWLLVGLKLTLSYLASGSATLSTWWFVLPACGLTAWHGFRIMPYTPLYPQQAKPTSSLDRQSRQSDPGTIRIVVSNVEQENDRFDQWRDVISDANPDILVVLESDDRWVEAARPLFERYPHRVVCPQDNWYGMMMLSRLPIEQHQVRYWVQDDIPSIDARIRLTNDQCVRMIAVHPRPPEPWRGNHATARDAELTLWGEELAQEPGPVIISGDLNDVAWSATTRLFLRTSNLLDPRRGRGFFNTFHADHWFCRFPLDHIFHSKHLTVNEIRRLSHIGSDHFPMLIELRLNPQREDDHHVLEEKSSDDEEVATRVERAERSEATEVGTSLAR